jgi:hypothetical protein
MSASIEMVSPNTFIGIIADISRASAVSDVKELDSRRLLWVKYFLPEFMKKEFIESVVREERKPFKVNVPTKEIENLGPFFHEPSTLNHVAVRRVFTQLATNAVPVAYIPWDIKVVFHPSARTLFDNCDPAVNDEITAIFKKNGWYFRPDTSGFTIAPTFLRENLKAISDAYCEWEVIMGKYLCDAFPPPCNVFDGLGWRGDFDGRNGVEVEE